MACRIYDSVLHISPVKPIYNKYTAGTTVSYSVYGGVLILDAISLDSCTHVWECQGFQKDSIYEGVLFIRRFFCNGGSTVCSESYVHGNVVVISACLILTCC